MAPTHLERSPPACAGAVPRRRRSRVVTIRLSADVVDAFKATGAGWQTRVDSALKDWLKQNPPS